MRCAACTRFNLLVIGGIVTTLVLFAAQYVPAQSPAPISVQAPKPTPAATPTSPTVITITPSLSSGKTADSASGTLIVVPSNSGSAGKPVAESTAVTVAPTPAQVTAAAPATALVLAPISKTTTKSSTVVIVTKPGTTTPSTPAPTPTIPPLCNPTKTVGGDHTKLRSGWKGVDYGNNLVEPNGTKPFTFTLNECALPSGIALRPDGRLYGKANETGTFRFSVTVRDSATPSKSFTHYYELRMYLPTNVVGANKPPAQQTVTGIPLSEAERQAREQKPRMTVYQLTEAKIAELMKPPSPPAKENPAGDVAAGSSSQADGNTSASASDSKPGKEASADKAQDAESPEDAIYRKQLLSILLELNDIEYPSRDLFEKALDAALCSYVNNMATSALKTGNVTAAGKANTTRATNTKSQKLVLPPIVCPALPVEKRPALESPTKGEADTVPPAELPQRILPDDMRKRVIDRAREEYFFGGKQQRILWSGGDCGCLNEGLNRQVYGFYPFWRAAGGELGSEGTPPQLINFSLMSRIAYVALPIDDTGSFNNTMQLNDSTYPKDFIRVAKRHRTQLDVVLYRNTWQSLLKDEAKMNRLIAQLPDNALNLIDTRLADPASRVQSWLSFIEPAPRLGDGLTLYFDDFGDVDPLKFAEFFDKLMKAMIKKMRSRPRQYALNVVIPDRLLNRAPAFMFEKLLDYMVTAEKLEMRNERIATNVESAASNSNVDINYLILLSEPTTDTKKKLRQSAELPDATSLKGSNRKFFLRNLIPVIAYAGANGPNANRKHGHFADDLIYLSDNFNGVGLWNMPYNNPAPDLGAGVYDELSNNLLASNSSELFANTKLCSFICINRWWGRLLLITLLLIGIVSLPVRMLVCNQFAQSPRYLYFLWLGGIGTASVAIAILSCDPELKQWIAPLFNPKIVLGVAAAAAALVVLLEKRKRYQKP
ncbi:MAG: hypothetical protein ACK5YB_02375 [Burkholderiales bacterium]